MHLNAENRDLFTWTSEPTTLASLPYFEYQNLKLVLIFFIVYVSIRIVMK